MHVGVHYVAHSATLSLLGAPVTAPVVLRRTAGPRSPAPLCRAQVSVELLRNSWGTRFTNFLENPAPPPGTLILLRHGASEAEQREPRVFVGWSDPDLCELGEQQAIEAARAIKEAGYTFDIVYTSMLKRAVRTVWLLLMELECIHVACWKTWRLNERCYGALTGRTLQEMQAKYGADTVAGWRRAFTARPPPFDPASPLNPDRDPRYKRWYDRRGVMRPVAVPDGESMQDTIARCLPVWKQEILPDLRRGKSVLVVAHANSIRALVQTIDGVTNDELRDLEIPVAIPLVYRFDRKNPFEDLADQASWAPSWLQLRRRRTARQALQQLANLVPIVSDHSASPLSGEYLAKPSKLAAAQESVRAASLRRYGITPPLPGSALGIPTLLPPPPPTPPPADAARRSTELPTTTTTTSSHDEASATAASSDTNAHDFSAPPLTDTHVLSGGSSGGVWVRPRPPRKRDQQYVIIIRHGKTEHNKLGLFTGWEDVELAEEGRQEAIRAGKLLRAHGIEFDVVYTSWLQRAIETAWLVLVELDAMWLPIHKSWRLNERM